MSKQAADHHKKAGEHSEHAAQNHKEAAKYHAAGNTRKLRTMPTSRMPTICMWPIIQRRPPNPTSNITARSNAFAVGRAGFPGLLKSESTQGRDRAAYRVGRAGGSGNDGKLWRALR